MDGRMGAKAMSKIVSEYDQEITQTADNPWHTTIKTIPLLYHLGTTNRFSNSLTPISRHLEQTNFNTTWCVGMTQ